MLRLLSFALLLLIISPANADDGFFGGFVRSLNNKPYGFAKAEAPEPVRAGSYSQRFELRNGDCGSDSGWSDCQNDRQRTELSSNRKFTMGEEIWIAYSIFFPKDYWDSNDFNTCVGQIHQHGGPKGMANGLPSGPPLIQFETKDGYFSIKYHELSGSSSNIIDDGIKTDLAKLDLLRGKWTDVLFHIKFAKEDGFLEIFINGKKKYNLRNGATILRNKQGKEISYRKDTNFIIFEPQDFYFKYGIYQSFISRHIEKTGTVVPTQIVYYDEVRVGSSRDDVDITMHKNDPVD